jgi:hypothetical protein
MCHKILKEVMDVTGTLILFTLTKIARAWMRIGFH